MHSNWLLDILRYRMCSLCLRSQVKIHQGLFLFCFCPHTFIWANVFPQCYFSKTKRQSYLHTSSMTGQTTFGKTNIILIKEWIITSKNTTSKNITSNVSFLMLTYLFLLVLLFYLRIDKTFTGILDNPNLNLVKPSLSFKMPNNVAR